jgi:hypothetical protein
MAPPRPMAQEPAPLPQRNVDREPGRGLGLGGLDIPEFLQRRRPKN